MDRMNRIKDMESKTNCVQSMINFLKQSPHKFDINVCDGFLKKQGLFVEFEEIVKTYLRDCQDHLDLTHLNSFTSDNSLEDFSNRSLLKSMDSHRKIELKRFGYLPVLQSIDSPMVGCVGLMLPKGLRLNKESTLNRILPSYPNILTTPSRKEQRKERKRYAPSCPRLKDKTHALFAMWSRHKKRSTSTPSSPSLPQSVLPRRHRLGRDIDLYSILYIQEITQLYLGRQQTKG